MYTNYNVCIMYKYDKNTIYNSRRNPKNKFSDFEMVHYECTKYYIQVKRVSTKKK